MPAGSPAVVTGGSGYFGSLLLARLRAAGYACTSVDLNDAEDRPDAVRFVRADVRDAPAMARALSGAQVVFHNVAQVPLAKDRALFQSVNVEGTRVLLEAARGNGVRKVVHTSSSAVYGVPPANPVTEDTPAVPGEDYGRAKLDAERLCARYAAEGLDVSIVRPRTILGHGRLGIFQILFEWIRTGQNVPVLGAGHNVYQFVHADDLAQACLLAAERPGAESFNCGAERFGTMRAALEALCAHAGTGSRVRSVPMAPAVAAMKLTSALGISPLGAYHALMYGRSMYFDIAKAKRLLGWQPRYSNHEMLAESYDWYCAHRDEILRAAAGSPHRSAVRMGVLALARWVL